MKMDKEKNNFLLTISVLIYVFIGSILVTYNIIDIRIYGIILSFFGVAILINYCNNKNKRNDFEKITIALSILSILSCIGATSMSDALFGLIGRGEGLYVILTYYLLFLNCLNIKDKKYIKIIIYAILIIGGINIVCGILQIDFIDINYIKNKWYYAKGLLGNSMSFGALMSLCYPIVLSLFLNSEKKNKILNLLLLLIFSIGVIIAGTMSCFVSIIMIILFTIFIIFKEKQDRLHKFISIMICIITLVGLFFIISIKKTDLTNDIKELFQQTSNISEGKIDNDYGTGRVYIWKNTIDKIIENPFGVGIDNYKYAFNPPIIDKISGLTVTKAHNDYLQKMLCEGIITGILYIFLLLYIFFKKFNLKKDKLEYGIYLSFICYSINIFFTISVTRVAPIYFIILGLAGGLDEKN